MDQHELFLQNTRIENDEFPQQQRCCIIDSIAENVHAQPVFKPRCPYQAKAKEHMEVSSSVNILSYEQL